MNPFKEKAKKPEDYLESLKDLYPVAYDKNATDPYTKARIVLACGAEYEANWHSHQMQRHIAEPSLRRDLALMRFVEKEQQQKLAHLKPTDESVLETTITYEQLAVDLTAEMARNEQNFYVKKALDFALLEDFDHLYRYADLLDNDYGIHAERLVGGYTEIMPARPTIAHHRHPYDNVKRNIDAKKSPLKTVLNTMIITAAEQQTMNFYMNVAATYKNDVGRRLYEEICLVEEEHVTQYGSLIDTSLDLVECTLMHEYVECYLYWSNYVTESDGKIKEIWARFFEAELSHLHAAEAMLKKYCKKDHTSIIADGEFPEPLSLHENIDYVRDIIQTTAQYTGKLTDYKNVADLEDDDRFFSFNSKFTKPDDKNPAHEIIRDYIMKKGKDYRFEQAEHPIERLRNRKYDDAEIGIVKNAAKSSGFKPAKPKKRAEPCACSCKNSTTKQSPDNACKCNGKVSKGKKTR